ncbi:MAG: response regulator [Gemmatimonadales bacterium]|nr:response regulator [Gemmatimonadales bacterium]
MTQTGAAQRTRGVRAIPSALATRWPARDWARLGRSVPGVLLTLALVVIFDVLAVRDMPVVHPFPILLLSVAFSAYRGGTTPGLISAVLTELYAVYFLAEPVRSALRYAPANAYSLLVMGVASAGIAILMGRLRAAADRARTAALAWEEAEALDRRLSFFAQASATLASSLDYEVTMRELARLTVPGMADWCAIHVVSEQGGLQFVSGAHRDPTRDLVVRALCEYGSRSVPFADPGAEPRVAEVTDDQLQDRAEDAEQLKIYRALAPTTRLQVPLLARGQLAGVITLATARDYGRRFSGGDLDFARELGQRASLAVENSRLFLEAQEADRRYRILFEANPQPMWVLDVDTLAFLAVNDAAVRHYGYSREEFLGMTIMDIRPPDDMPGLSTGMERSPHREGVALSQHQRKDGSIVDMELISHALELDGRRARLVLATDSSDRIRTRAALHQSEEQLRQAQRMDVVGRLASGVAHDFNNLLTTIRGFSEMLLLELPGEHRNRPDVERIRKAADRGALLTRQLLTFGRRQSLQPKVLELDAVITGLEGLIRRMLGADIRLELRLAPGVGAVRIDPGQLEQVVVNLLLNASDAMPSGGTLRLEIAERQISGSSRRRHLRPGRYVVLAVSDSGSGMDSETMTHLFEAGPGSAPSGQRRGLGLSIVHGIVRRNGGVVRISSEPGQGTTVKVYLPQVEAEEVAAASAVHPLRGDETILVVEDEEGVRELVRKVLVDHGHTVLEARHGRDALLVAERYERPISLLVTDVVMPEMGGAELARRLTEKRPDLKVLYVSGYTSDEVVRRGIRNSGTFVQKPFSADDLMLRIRGMLDTAG